VGVEVLEGYGLTETSPVVSVNRPGRRKLGTVGPPMPGVEVKIASNGEVLVRGPNVMRGYFKDAEATAEAIDREGWFHTGDIGEVDGDGFLKITDRIKDLLITSGGKNIAPQPIENELVLHPLIDQVCVVGDRRQYLTVLLVPDFQALEKKVKAAALFVADRAALVKHPDVIRWYQEALDAFNAKQPRFQTIKHFTLLARPWSVEGEEITPTLKLRRRTITRKYADVIEKMYE